MAAGIPLYRMCVTFPERDADDSELRERVRGALLDLDVDCDAQVAAVSGSPSGRGPLLSVTFTLPTVRSGRRAGQPIDVFTTFENALALIVDVYLELDLDLDFDQVCVALRRS